MSKSEERKPLLADASDEQESYTDKDKKKDKEKKKPDGPPPATLGQLFRYATCVDTICILFGSLFSLAHGAGWPVLSIVMGQMTDTFVAGPNGSLIPPDPNATHNPNVTVESFEDKMTTYALYYLIIGGVVLLSGYLQIACFMTACERQVNKIRKQFFQAILRQEIGWFDKHQSGELTTRLSDDLERVREGIGDKLSLLIQFVAQFFAGFAIGFYKSWNMTLVMMSLTPLLAILGGYFSALMQNFAKREQALYADAGSVAEEVISCMRTVVSFNGQKQEVKRYGKSLEETKQIGIKKSMVTGLLLGSLYLVMFGDYALSFWYGNEQVKKFITSNGEDGITPGTVLTVSVIMVDLGKLKIDLSMDKTINDYPLSSLPSKQNKRTGKAKLSLFEQIDPNLYDEHAKIITFYTNLDRIQPWIKTLDIYYYDNLGKEPDYDIEWYDEPKTWENRNNSGNSVMIEVLKKGELQFNITFFVTTGTIRVQGSHYYEFVDIHFPILKDILDKVLTNISQTSPTNTCISHECHDDNNNTHINELCPVDKVTCVLPDSQTGLKSVLVQEDQPQKDDFQRLELNLVDTLAKIETQSQ
ncbi:ABCB1 [Mytilus edulis]|uniref:ABCB1 n=1 Tax=Mytilus edulis TaxID=6550 RepID=A0A8S3SME4_MYTED|nr:ABCB1 [Mytilus edulis]